jgi:hypothetical protein
MVIGFARALYQFPNEEFDNSQVISVYEDYVGFSRWCAVGSQTLLNPIFHLDTQAGAE